jgi:hypothetical protein
MLRIQAPSGDPSSRRLSRHGRRASPRRPARSIEDEVGRIEANLVNTGSDHFPVGADVGLAP